jgi:hypothetical protein
MTIPSEAITIGKAFEVLARLELMEECLDYTTIDIGNYIDGCEITYGLDFVEMYPLLFNIPQNEVSHFSEISKIWSGILPLKEEKNKIHEGLNFMLLPGTIFEFFNKLYNRNKIIERLDKNKFDSLIRFLEALDRKPQDIKKFWTNVFELGMLDKLSVVLEEKGADKLAIDPLKRLRSLLEKQIILPMEDVPQISKIIKQLHVHEPSLERAYEILSNQRPGRELNNSIDAYNISFVSFANQLIERKKKYHLNFASHGYATLLAAKKASEENLSLDKLPIQRHSLAVSYMFHLIKNINLSEARDFLREAKIPLKKSIKLLREEKKIDKILNMSLVDKRKYLRMNKDKPLFLPYKLFLTMQYLHREYIDLMQAPSRPELDQMMQIIELPLSRVFERVLDWRQIKEVKKRVIIEGHEFKKEIDKMLAKHYQNFLPLNNPNIAEVLEWVNE